MRRLFLLLVPLCLSMAPNLPRSTPLIDTSISQTPELDPATSLPTPAHFTHLASADPVKMLEYSIARYQREVHGYRATLEKQERINGKLRQREIVKVDFREEPFSVLMRWTSGADRASATMFVAGENKNKLLIKPRGPVASLFVNYVSRDLDNPDVKNESRFSMRDFGVQKGTLRTYHAWKSSQERGDFRFEYEGIRNLTEAGDRPCHIIRRMVNPPEEDGLTEVTIGIDVETWLQVCSFLKAGDELIAEYHFRDIELNPEFAPKHFHPDTLKK